MKVSMRPLDAFSLSEPEMGKFVFQLLRCHWTDLKVAFKGKDIRFLTAHVLSVFA